MSAIFSPDGVHRYRLDRDVQLDGIVAALIGVNPSIAGVTKNDQTIAKDIGFAKVHGWRKIIKVNVFSFVSTKVRGLATCAEARGPDYFGHLVGVIDEADVVIACWGSRDKVPKPLRHHIDEMCNLLAVTTKPVLTFGLTKSGDPMHPLMLGYSTPLVPFEARSQ